MTQVCHECGCNVESPFYVMSAVLKDEVNKRIAYSDMEVSLCHLDFEKVRSFLHQTPEELREVLGYSLDGAIGVYGGLTNTVQVSSGVHARYGEFKFLDKNIASQELPKSAKDLFANPHWTELTEDGKWKEAKWAKELYEKLI